MSVQVWGRYAGLCFKVPSKPLVPWPFQVGSNTSVSGSFLGLCPRFFRGGGGDLSVSDSQVSDPSRSFPGKYPRWGYSVMGYPQQGQDWDISSQDRTGAADGIPLASTQEDFLVTILKRQNNNEVTYLDVDLVSARQKYP